MYWQSFKKVPPDPNKLLQIYVHDNCYFARSLKLNDGKLIFITSLIYAELFDVKHKLVPFFTFEQLQKRDAYWSLFTKPGEQR